MWWWRRGAAPRYNRRVLAFLHTAPAHVATFEALLRAEDPHVATYHTVDASLLDDARAAGAITPAIARRVADAITTLAASGAAVVLCTCSTIGGAAEAAPAPTGTTVLRVDRPMATRAVALGSRIAVVAALPSTLEPTRQLLCDAARRAGRAIDIVEVSCAEAWPHFERGDAARYLDLVGRAVERAAQRADVVVLAQASMAPVAGRTARLPVPVLSSPRLGVDAALRLYRQHQGLGGSSAH